MALAPCLLVLVLAVAPSQGELRRPAVQVERLEAPPAAATEAERGIEPEPELEVCGTSARFRAVPDGAVCVQTTRSYACASTLQPVLCSILVLPASRDECRHDVPCAALLVECRRAREALGWPPTALRWQAAPRRPWRHLVPASSQPLFWLHERPPLRWPSSRSARPLHLPVPPERPKPPRPRVCSGVLRIVRFDELEAPRWSPRLLDVSALTSGRTASADPLTVVTTSTSERPQEAP